jgi:hypothetical protein
VSGLVEPFSDNFNVVLDEGIVGQDYNWIVDNQTNPNKAVYTLDTLGDFNP